MKNRKQIRSIADKAVKASFKEGKLVSSKALKFVKLFSTVPKSKAIELLSEFLRRIKLETNLTKMTVESTGSLSGKQKEIIRKKFSTSFKITTAQFKLNPQILGGLRIKVGDHIYDDSLLARIYQVKEVIRGAV